MKRRLMHCFLLTENKEWQFLTFFPLEDENKLKRLRGKLTPFLVAVSKALSYELERGYANNSIKRSILDEIIQNIPSENATSINIPPSSHTIDTLKMEFNDILDRFQLQLSQCFENFLGHFNMWITTSKLLI